MHKEIIKRIYKILCLIVVGIVALSLDGSSKLVVNKANNETITNTVDLNMMALKVQEDINNDLYAAKDTYVGHLTGYTADCPLCTGHLACMSKLDVLNGNEHYEDKDYGKVRIVASSKNLACGTIVRFNKSSISNEPIIAIVLDRGVLGTSLDLLTNSHEYAITNIGRSTVSYDILRESWGKKE